MVKKITGIMTAAALMLPAVSALMPAASAAEEIISISSLNDLKSFRDSVNSGTDYYGLTVTLRNNISGLGSWTPIGDETHPFKGTFNGKGYSISGITGFSGSSNYNGLFGYVEDGTIKNLEVTGSASNSGYAVGSIAGCLTGGNALISCCHSNVTITSSNGNSDSSVGGIAGFNTSGTITNCYNTGSVTATYNVGGIAGKSAYGTVSYCHNQGTVTLNANGDDAGSLIGDESYDEINYCYYPADNIAGIGNGTSEPYTDRQAKALSTSEMKTQSSFTGFDFTDVWKMGSNYPVLDFDKLCGWDDHIEDLDELMQLRDWVNAGTLLTQYPSFTTYYLDTDIDMSSISDWTPIGTSTIYPTNKTFSIAFDGQNHTISNLTVNGSGYDDRGLFGYVTGSISNLTVSGSVRGNYQAGLIVGTLRGVYENQKGTLANCTANGTVTGSNSVGGVVGRAIDYSVLTDCAYTGSGSVSANTGVTSSTAGGIVGFASGQAEIINCVNSGSGVISVNSSNAGGIAGRAQSNVKLTDCIYSGSGTVSGGSYVGGIVGDNSGTVTDCDNTGSGTVSGTSAYIGGIAGRSTGALSGCDNTGTVSGDSSNTDSVGGIVGLNSGTVTGYCHNSGTVKKGVNIGGIAGKNNNLVQLSYNTGAIGEANYENTNVGGAAGSNDASGAVLQNCYNTGNVYGNCAGGVIGISIGTVQNCHNISSEVYGSGSYGGVIGNNNGGTVKSCYFIPYSGYYNLAGEDSGTVDSYSSMKMPDAFLDETTFVDWDFNDTSIWTINKTLGAPDFFDMKLTDSGEKSTGYYTDGNGVYHEDATGFIVNFTNGAVSPEKAYIGWKVTPEGGSTMTFAPTEITGVTIGADTTLVIGLIVTELEDENAELKAYAVYE